MKSKLDEAIDRLEEEDWDEDSSVSVNVQMVQPPKSSAPVPIQVLKTLPPWGRVVVLLAFLGVAVASGVGAQLVLHAIGISK